MTTLKLKRQDYQNPNMKLLNEMRSSLEDLIYSDIDYSSEKWLEMANDIIGFQAEDGSFNLLDSFKIESDCRVEYCYEPTYICTALLMKTCLVNESFMTDKVRTVLSNALDMCCGRSLKGHGYDSVDGQIKALGYFMHCGLNEFIDLYPDISCKFTSLIERIKESYEACVTSNSYPSSWGKSYKAEILKVNAYFQKEKYVFVYGTLMKGQANHDYLEDKQFVGDGYIMDYEMYDLDSYPGIISGHGKVLGEVYRVDSHTERNLDYLEGEGSLYMKTPVKVYLDEMTRIDALVYVYNRSVKGCAKLTGKYGDKAAKDEYVWYVSYGSNLLEERMSYYIQGGTCPFNGKSYDSCTDSTMPIESRQVMIPFDMYYANFNRGSWKNSAVCFLDISHKGKAYGKAYKILKSQLEEIHIKEGRSDNWYPDLVQLEDIDNLPCYTFSNENTRPKESFDRVSFDYGLVLYLGMKETYPELSTKAILNYLKECGNRL